MKTSEDVHHLLDVVCADLVDPPANLRVVDNQLWSGGDCNGNFIDPNVSDAVLIVQLADAVRSFVSYGAGRSRLADVSSSRDERGR